MKKFLTAAFMTAALTAGVISVHALGTKAQASSCGVSCIAPKLSCPGGCFCDLSMGNGIDTGVCVSRH